MTNVLNNRIYCPQVPCDRATVQPSLLDQAQALRALADWRYSFMIIISLLPVLLRLRGVGRDFLGSNFDY